MIAQRPVEVEDEFVVQLKQRIAYVKQRKKWKVEYMKLSVYEMDHQDELRAAREEGEAREARTKERDIQATVEILQELNISDVKVREKIMSKFGLTAKQADQFLK